MAHKKIPVPAITAGNDQVSHVYLVVIRPGRKLPRANAGELQHPSHRFPSTKRQPSHAAPSCKEPLFGRRERAQNVEVLYSFRHWERLARIARPTHEEFARGGSFRSPGSVPRRGFARIFVNPRAPERTRY